MQTSTKLLAAAMALPLALGMAMPANAGPNRGYSDNTRHSYDANQRDIYSDPRIERQLDQVAQEIRQARRSGELDRYDARNFQNKLDAVVRAYQAFARNGLSRNDIRITMTRLDAVSYQLSDAIYGRNQNNRYGDRKENRSLGYRR